MSAPRRIGTEFDAAAFAHQGRTHEVFRAGHGPGVIVVHETRASIPASSSSAAG